MNRKATRVSWTQDFHDIQEEYKDEEELNEE